VKGIADEAVAAAIAKIPPPPAPVDLRPLTAQVAALEQKLNAPPPPSLFDGLGCCVVVFCEYGFVLWDFGCFDDVEVVLCEVFDGDFLYV
jgi:hypothetical protein